LCIAKKVAITVRLAPDMIFEWPALEQIRFKERRTPARVYLLLLPRGDSKMNRHDQELLDKQLWGVSSRSPQNGITVLMIVAVFLVGMGIGDIVSKTKQANTHYAALISFPNGQE
jgi:hypothetical protein